MRIKRSGSICWFYSCNSFYIFLNAILSFFCHVQSPPVLYLRLFIYLFIFQRKPQQRHLIYGFLCLKFFILMCHIWDVLFWVFLLPIDLFGWLNVVPNSNPLGIKRFVLGISVSFKCECHIITQIQYTKNLNPGSFQLGTTVRSLKIVTTLKIGSKECRVCAFYLPRFKINLIKFINAQINCYCSIPSSGSWPKLV